MNAALIFEDERGNTHHFKVELSDRGLPTNPMAIAHTLRKSKALREPCILRMQVVEVDVVEKV